MKVKIGKYTSWYGPYQLAQTFFFWTKRYCTSEDLESRWDYRLRDRFGYWLADTWVSDFLVWLDSKKKRKVKIHIDDYDVWGMHNTLSLIIVPMLKKLKENKCGSALVDLEDVPKRLRGKPTKRRQSLTDIRNDDLVKARWEWVLNEMIWAHEQIVDDAEPYWKDGNCQVLDLKKYNAHQKRISNGLKLFGKYYLALWD